ncbi:Salicylate hydroxylase [Madurella mycetomatis]|uniref:Salicylate hydroxylase n=1 Tax=Madurella mycetomatis TaxID=100816 RepID=A0A175WBR3_9PEZI|nr:Salicylate hydroxylase [Madurella mycetomatis]
MGNHARSLNGEMYLSPPSGGQYILTYPIEHHKTINMVAVVSDHTCPHKWMHESWLQPSTHDEILQDFPGWDPALVGLFARFGSRDKWALFDYPNTDDRAYFRGRVCLVGDAAHATTPHLGGGAGMAFEDAYILADLLGNEMPCDPKRLEAVFGAYDAVRRPRTQEMVKLSRLTGLAYMLREEEGVHLEKTRKNISTRLHWVWNGDLEESLARAKEFVKTQSYQPFSRIG